MESCRTCRFYLPKTTQCLTVNPPSPGLERERIRQGLIGNCPYFKSEDRTETDTAE